MALASTIFCQHYSILQNQNKTTNEGKSSIYFNNGILQSVKQTQS